MEPRFQQDHIFPADVRLLLDSYDYENLYDDDPLLIEITPPVWLRRSFDGDDGSTTTVNQENNWNPTLGGVCAQPLSACTFRSSTNPQNNWLFTQYVGYSDSLQVLFNISHNFRCTDSNCSPFVTMYKFDTDGIVGEQERTNRDNYRPLFGTEEASRLDGSGDTGNVMETLSFPRMAGRQGFYLAFRDTGTCVTIGRVLLYFSVALGRSELFLGCPDVPLPGNGQTFSTRSCTCVNGTSPVGSLDRSCDENGVCNEDQRCECDAGFGYNSTLEMCTACPVGTYKAEVANSSCLPCPALSEARDPGSAICECIPPNSRGGDGPETDCRDRRFSTSAAVAITFFVTFLIVGVAAFLGGGVVAYLCRERIEKVV